MTRYATFLPLTLLLFVASCRHSVEPAAFKSPRDYTWEVTNLSSSEIPSPIMWSIWAGSLNDVYVCGEGTHDGRGEIFHFDGKNWARVNVWLGSQTFFTLRQLIGFAPNDIWAVGGQQFPSSPTADSAFVLHFDGTHWNSVLPSGMGVARLRCVWGTSSSNIYCGSQDGKIMHFDGSSWAVQILYPRLSFNAIGGDRDRIFATGNTYKGTIDDSTLCFSKTSGDWTLVYVSSTTRIIAAFYSPIRNTYYAAGYGLYQWTGERWQQLPLPFDAWFLGVTGTGPDNVLALGHFYPASFVYHWNGIDWTQISFDQNLLPSGVGLYAAWTDGREAFIVGNNSITSFVLRGR
jgi:hypothetical protein